MIFLDWFLKTLIPPISKDISFEHPQYKEEAILKAQQFDLIYAQPRYLYTIIPCAPYVGTSHQDALRESHVVYGIIEGVA